jgi:hypothetical protein
MSRSQVGLNGVLQLTVREPQRRCQEELLALVFADQRRLSASSSSSVRGQSEPSRRERLRSARTLPPVWQRRSSWFRCRRSGCAAPFRRSAGKAGRTCRGRQIQDGRR